MFSILFNLAFSQSGKLIINGVLDGPLAGGTPKGVELFVRETITDLSKYAQAFMSFLETVLRKAFV